MLLIEMRVKFLLLCECVSEHVNAPTIVSTFYKSHNAYSQMLLSLYKLYIISIIFKESARRIKELLHLH